MLPAPGTKGLKQNSSSKKLKLPRGVAPMAREAPLRRAPRPRVWDFSPSGSALSFGRAWAVPFQFESGFYKKPLSLLFAVGLSCLPAGEPKFEAIGRGLQGRQPT